MPRSKKSTGMPRLGKQPPRFRFFLNPYADMRFTSCPQCRAKTRQRKLPLVIHVQPMHMISLNKTCRYCPACDLLIAHQDDLEDLLARMFAERAPEDLGNDYLVVGTMDRADWQRNVPQQSALLAEMLETVHDFQEVVGFKLTY